MKKNLTNALMLAGALVLVGTPSFAQKKKKGDDTPTPPKQEAPAKPKSEIKPIAEVTKACRAIPGLFTIYQDTTNGSAYIQVEADKIGKEFIYFRFIMDGAVAAGHFRGAYGGNDIVKIEKYYNRIEFVKQHTGFYFDPNNAVSKAADANLVNAILFSGDIVGQDEGKYLLKADPLFLSEALEQVKRSSENPRAFRLGGLSKDKTKYLYVKAYPANTDVAVEYVYDNPAPSGYGGPNIADNRYVSVRMQHSFVEVPKNDFKPRMDDPRIGYFSEQITDMTSMYDATPYRDVINRWHLKKKDPVKAISEVEEPIVWWIENTTPKEFRDAVKQGVLAWNRAFEKAGFKHAMVVKEQPDDATWDAGDIRYNVLRWTSSPIARFLGYGPSFTNPRTGQILGADIMLEYGVFTRYKRYDKLLQNNAYRTEEEAIEGLHEIMFGGKGNTYCAHAAHLSDGLMMGESVLRAGGGHLTEEQLKGLREQAMLELVMHEVGHTLGLNHNMKASQLYSPDEINDMAKTTLTGLTGSVMDYATINMSPDRTKQGHYFSVAVGPYDMWAIEFGYKPDATDEELKAIAARSSQRELAFGNDADDMRSPGNGIDPRVMIDDLTSDVVAYSIGRMDMVMSLMPQLRERFKADGESYHELVSIYQTLAMEYGRAARATSRYVGGVYVERGMQGEAGATKPFTPAPYEYQKKAMATLAKYVFGKDAFKAPADLYSYLQLQRRGYNFFGSPEDPKVHAALMNIQEDILSHLLHPATLQRIIDSEVYGNKYKLDEMMTELNDAIFKDDMMGNISVARQNAQLIYTNMLLEIVAGKSSAEYQYSARSMALHNLKKILDIAKNGSGDTLTKAHKEHLKLLIEKALDD